MSLPMFPNKSACESAPDPDIFFPDDTGDRALFNQAKAYCDKCDNVLLCLEYAVSEPGLEGIWGGTSLRMRERLRAMKKKARQ